MAKELGDLIVKLSLDSANFEDGIKRFQAQMTKVQAEFKNSATGITDFDKATAKLKTSADTLTSRLKMQQDEVARLEAAHRRSVDAKGADAEETQKLAAKLDAARARVAQTEKALALVNGQIAQNENGWHRLSVNLDGIGKKLQSVGDSLTKVGKKMSVGVSAPIAGLGTLALKAGIEFESAFAGVRKTVSASEADFQFLSDSIKGMAEEIPRSTTELSGIMEMAGQLGVKGKGALLEFTKAIAGLGVSTNLTEEDAASMLAQFANITGMNIETGINKLGSVVVALGNNFATTESDIVRMAHRLAGAGSQLGLSEASIMGFSAALSSVGIEAEAGGTAFSKLMINMKVAADTGTKGNEVIAKTGKTLRELQMLADKDAKSFKALANKLGMTSTEFKTMLGATADLENFAKVTGMTADEFAKKFGDDAPGAIMAFLQGLNTIDENGGSVITTLDEMGITETRLRDTIQRASQATDLFTDAQTLANEAWGEGAALTNEANQRYETTESKLLMLKNAANNLAMEFGEIMLPTFQKIIDALRGLIDWFKGLSDGQKQTIITIGLVVAAIGPALIAIGKVTSAVGSIMSLLSPLAAAIGGVKTATGALGAVFGFITSPIGIAIAAIAALVAALVWLYNNNEWFREQVDRIWGAICQFFATLPETFSNAVNAIAGFFQNFGANVTAWAQSFCATLQALFDAAWALIQLGVQVAWDGITTWLSGIWSGISGTALSVWNGITSRISAAVASCKAALESAWNKITDWLSGLWSGMKGTASTLWNAITGAIDSAVQTGKTKLTNAWNAASTAVSGVWNSLKGTATASWNAVCSNVSSAVSGAKGAIQSAWTNISSGVSTGWSSFKSTATTSWNSITGAVSSAVTGGKSRITSAWDSVRSAVSATWSKVTDAIRRPVQSAYDAVSGIVSQIKGCFNFSWKLPRFSLPKVNVSWSEVGLGIKIPKFSISWNKLGGIFKKPTIFATGNAGLQGVGEAGPEAILPLDTLWAEMGARLKAGMREILTDMRRSEANRDEQVIRTALTILAASRRDTPSVNVTQHIHADETSYVGQQREAARNFRQIARALG